MNKLQKLAFTLLAPIAIGGTSLIAPEAKAQTYPAVCTDPYGFPGGSACRGTPTGYFTRIYELGICKSDPISGSGFDFEAAECVKTYSKDSPTEIDLASGDEFKLGETSDFPFDTYTHTYMIVSNKFGYRGRINVAGAGLFTTTGVTLNTSIAGRPNYHTGQMAIGGGENRYDDEVKDFEGGLAGCTGQIDSYKLPDDPGTVSAFLADANNQKTCGNGVSRIIASFAFGSPVEITGDSELKVEFSVTNFGIYYQQDGGGGVEAVGGPFMPRFSVN